MARSARLAEFSCVGQLVREMLHGTEILGSSDAGVLGLSADGCRLCNCQSYDVQMTFADDFCMLPNAFSVHSNRLQATFYRMSSFSQVFIKFYGVNSIEFLTSSCTVCITGRIRAERVGSHLDLKSQSHLVSFEGHFIVSAFYQRY